MFVSFLRNKHTNEPAELGKVNLFPLKIFENVKAIGIPYYKHLPYRFNSSSFHTLKPDRLKPTMRVKVTVHQAAALPELRTSITNCCI